MDTLRVEAQGPVLTFHVNGMAVDQISDTDYTGGELGFYVETFDSPKVHVHYYSLSVSKPASIQAEPPAPADLLYQADFTDRHSGWPDELVFDNYYVGYHEPVFYHVEVHVPHDNAIAVVPGRTFDNFTAETDVLTDMANTAPTGDFRYGLVFRRVGNRYYAFTISPRTRTWYVVKSGDWPASAGARYPGLDPGVAGPRQPEGERPRTGVGLLC